MKEDSEKAYLSVSEFSRKIGVHPHTVRMLIKKGTINAFKLTKAIKSKYFIPVSEIERIALFDLEEWKKKNL